MQKKPRSSSTKKNIFFHMKHFKFFIEISYPLILFYFYQNTSFNMPKRNGVKVKQVALF